MNSLVIITAAALASALNVLDMNPRERQVEWQQQRKLKGGTTITTTIKESDVRKMTLAEWIKENENAETRDDEGSPTGGSGTND